MKHRSGNSPLTFSEARQGFKPLLLQQERVLFGHLGVDCGAACTQLLLLPLGGRPLTLSVVAAAVR